MQAEGRSRVVDSQEVVLVGANPAVLLRDEGTAVAFASVWLVDWSVYGAGRVVVLVHDGRVRVLGRRPDLGGWLVDRFVQHFSEVRELGWAEPEFEVVDVQARLDVGQAMRTTAGEVFVGMTDVTDRRPFRQDALTLGGNTSGSPTSR